MDVGEIISDAIRYPSSDWKKIIILGVILIIPIVDFIGLGYILRIIKSTLAGYDDLPEFDDLSDLFIDGLKVLVVSIAYFIIPLIVISVGLVGSTALVSGAITNPLALVGLGVTSIIGGILFIIFELFWIIAIANMALYDELGAAFKFSEIVGRISNIGWGKYIIWYIVMIIIGIIFGIISGILQIIPVIGLIITVILIYSYFSMFGGRSVALIFASSEEFQKTPAPSQESVEEPSQTEKPEEPE
jgi:hypothetical protein